VKHVQNFYFLYGLQCRCQHGPGPYLHAKLDKSATLGNPHFLRRLDGAQVASDLTHGAPPYKGSSWKSRKKLHEGLAAGPFVDKGYKVWSGLGHWVGASEGGATVAPACWPFAPPFLRLLAPPYFRGEEGGATHTLIFDEW